MDLVFRSIGLFGAVNHYRNQRKKDYLHDVVFARWPNNSGITNYWSMALMQGRCDGAFNIWIFAPSDFTQRRNLVLSISGHWEKRTSYLNYVVTYTFAYYYVLLIFGFIASASGYWIEAILLAHYLGLLKCVSTCICIRYHFSAMMPCAGGIVGSIGSVMFFRDSALALPILSLSLSCFPDFPLPLPLLLPSYNPLDATNVPASLFKAPMNSQSCASKPCASLRNPSVSDRISR